MAQFIRGPETVETSPFPALLLGDVLLATAAVNRFGGPRII